MKRIVTTDLVGGWFKPCNYYSQKILHCCPVCVIQDKQESSHTLDVVGSGFTDITINLLHVFSLLLSLVLFMNLFRISENISLRPSAFPSFR